MSEGDRDMETVLKPEQKDMKASLLKAFQAYDINGGQVSRRPRLALLLRNFSLLLKPPPQDGFIDKDEMKAILTRSQASFGKSTDGALRETDGRADASFSDKQADDRWKSWLSAFDANGDGKLSVEELAEAMSYSGMVYELYQLVYFKKQSLQWSAQLTKLLDELKTVNDGKFLGAVLSDCNFNAGQDAALKGRTPLGVLMECNPYDYSKEVPTLIEGLIFGTPKMSGLYKQLVDPKYAKSADRKPAILKPHGKGGYTLLHMAVALHSERLVMEVLSLGYSIGGGQTQISMVQKKGEAKMNPKNLAQTYAREKFAATSQGNPGGKEVSPAEFEKVLAILNNPGAWPNGSWRP